MPRKTAFSLVWALVSGIGCADPEAGDDLGDAESGDESGDESGGELMSGAINGTCAPVGMHFRDVYTCNTVRGPSPTEPPISTSHVDDTSETLADPDYAWVVEQLQACSCTCCHSEGGVGSYKWSHDFPGAWTDSASYEVLDHMRWINRPSSLDAEGNNGFSRDGSAIPTTDADRLLSFLDRELARRE